MPSSRLTVRELTKIYNPRSLLPWAKKHQPYTAVDQISFELAEGEILGFLGPNGAGKTTTIQMLLSALTPTSGLIEYFGKDLSKQRSEVLQYVSFASTYINLPWRLSVYENLDVYGRLYGLSKKERAHRIEKFLKFFGIWELAHKERSFLSAGQSTRLVLAKAFLSYPKVALLDEPTASLDPDIAHEVREFVLAQRREHAVSILFTSHNMDEVTAVCDRVLFINKGKIVANDTPENLARSNSITMIHLLIGDGLKRLLEFCKKEKLPAKEDQRWVSVEIDEHKIPKFLSSLANRQVEYTQIRIDQPNLEKYFLKMAKNI